MVQSATLRDKFFQVAYCLAYRILICFWFIFRPSVRGVFVGIWYDGKILIIRNSYKTKYSVPGGYLKRNENPALAAVRELQEEINIRISPDHLNYMGEFTFFDEFKHDTVTFFEVKLSDSPEIKFDNREVIWGKFLTPSSALELNLTPPVQEYLEAIDKI
jgi:ADP-ribose pyrophosphatase YjhB (NUDIX family)